MTTEEETEVMCFECGRRNREQRSQEQSLESGKGKKPSPLEPLEKEHSPVDTLIFSS